jgi:hypothetical protein
MNALFMDLVPRRRSATITVLSIIAARDNLRCESFETVHG